jgi:hypothetical protein
MENSNVTPLVPKDKNTKEVSSLALLSLGTKGVTFEFSIKFLKP